MDVITETHAQLLAHFHSPITHGVPCYIGMTTGVVQSRLISTLLTGAARTIENSTHQKVLVYYLSLSPNQYMLMHDTYIPDNIYIVL